jgi:N-acetylglucosaminyl-diphospho-decaprenol L-rhamnosyltransferase
VNLNLSVIVVNHNTRDILLKCLASIARSADQSEVVVVDNGSTDGSVAAVRDEFPNVKIIRCSGNQGYSRANMLGFRASTAQYVLFLNSDTVVPSGALSRLVAFLEERPHIAACGPRLVGIDNTVQAFAFGRDPTICYLLGRACVRLGLRAPMHDWETTKVQPVHWVSGACLLVRRNAFDRVSGFDERIFLYFEDNDLCLRLRRAGWEVFYNPEVTVIHRGGASLPNITLRRKYYYDSLLYFYSKHYSVLERSLLKIMLPFYRWCLPSARQLRY